MRLILGILAMFALLTSSAYAQSHRTSNWTTETYSEENVNDEPNPSVREYDKFFRKIAKDPNRRDPPAKPGETMDMEFLSAVRCSGDYCDNKKFKFTSGFTVAADGGYYPYAQSLFNFSVSSSRFTSKESEHKKCPDGEYLVGLYCSAKSSYCGMVTGVCMKPILPEGTQPVCEVDGEPMQATISEEDKGIKANQIVLPTHQLFNGAKCSGPNCDNLTLSWCNIYGDEKGHVSLGVHGATWKNVLSVTGGSSTLSYTAGLESTTGSSDSVHASATLSVSKDFGVAEAGLEVTTGYAREWNNSKAASASTTVEVACDMRDDSVTTGDVYAFSLSARNMMGDPNIGFDAVSSRYLCNYGRSGTPAPVCLPGKCDNQFAKNCQKCVGDTLNVVVGKEEKPVQAKHTIKPQVPGSFVEFGGLWDWAAPTEKSPSVSYLVMYNGENLSDKFNLCADKECVMTDGLSFGDKIILRDVFGQTGSMLQFTRKAPGVLAGAYWSNGKSTGTPDGTIEIFQN